MSNNAYAFIKLTGGTAGCLDDLIHTNIGDGDMAFVTESTTNEKYVYTYEATNSDSPSSPDIITPISNSGNGRWVLVWTSLRTGIFNEANEWTAQQNFNELAITSTGNAAAWDLDAAQTAVHTMTQNTTISAPSQQNAGGGYVLRIVQAAGIYTLAFNAVFEWGESSAPVAPAANGDVIILSFYSDGTTMYGAEFNRVEA